MAVTKKMQIFGLKAEDGYDGVGISSIDQTTTSGKDGGINVITFTLSDGTTHDATIRNGSKGPQGMPGPDGVGIVSVEQTTSSLEDGGENIITMTLSNGEKIDFKVMNGHSVNGGMAIATKNELGCIIVGDGLNVREDGTTYLQYETGQPLTNLDIEAICQ